MTKRLIVSLLSILFLLGAGATPTAPKDGKKQMKTIREELKAQKAADALKGVESLRKDSSFRWNPQLLNYGVEACRILNSKENEKIYLKAKPDTLAFFKTLYDVFDYALLTDSAERIHYKQILAQASDVKPEAMKYRFRKQNAELLARYYRNLAAAPRYFSTLGKWDEAQKYAAMAIETAKSPLMQTWRRPIADSLTLRELALVCVNANYRLQRFLDMERYADIALQDSLNEESVREKLVYSATERILPTLVAQRLKEAHQKYPRNMFFFSRLVDYYLHEGDYEAVLATADRTLESVLEQAQELANRCVVDSLAGYSQPSGAVALDGVRELVTLPAESIAQIFEARAIAYHNSNRPRACIEEANNILSWNAEHPRADFYIGASYYRMAESVEIPVLVTHPSYQQATRERNRLLSLGRPHLEKYRQTNPDDSALWAPLLYETYLYLNLGPEFEEISRFIH